MGNMAWKSIRVADVERCRFNEYHRLIGTTRYDVEPSTEESPSQMISRRARVVLGCITPCRFEPRPRELRLGSTGL